MHDRSFFFADRRSNKIAGQVQDVSSNLFHEPKRNEAPTVLKRR